MDLFKGCDILVGKEKVHIDTIADALEKMVKTPPRPIDAKLRTPVSGVYKIKGVGDVITGRVEQSSPLLPRTTSRPAKCRARPASTRACSTCSV